MDNKKLQEMKSRVKSSRKISHKYYVGEITNDFLHELITAYKNQGELLQLSLANVDRLNEELADEQKNGDELVKQRNAWADVVATLRKQLADAQDIIDRDDTILEFLIGICEEAELENNGQVGAAWLRTFCEHKISIRDK